MINIIVKEFVKVMVKVMGQHNYMVEFKVNVKVLVMVTD
jgi:hypothetical protein